MLEVLDGVWRSLDLHEAEGSVAEQHKAGAARALPLVRAMDYASIQSAWTQLGSQQDDTGTAKRNMFRYCKLNIEFSCLQPEGQGQEQGCPPPQNYGLGLGLGLGNRTVIALVGNTLGLELKKFEDCWYYNLHWIKKYL